MNPSDASAEDSEFVPKSRLQWTLAILLLMLFVGVCFAGPYVVLLMIGPWAALPAAASAVFLYCKCRYNKRGSFGPFWLEFIDMHILIANVAVAILSIALIIRSLIA
jgi:hypothetical protein